MYSSRWQTLCHIFGVSYIYLVKMGHRERLIDPQKEFGLHDQKHTRCK